MKTTTWVSITTGKQLSLASFEALQRKAREAYEANPHLFEDEHDVLRAFGAVPKAELDHHLELLGMPLVTATAA
jgi:hypothetical protein